MCNKTGMRFAQGVLTATIVGGRDVIEVGAYDVNGSVRPHVESLEPASYLGVDITDGPRVDRVLDARDLVAALGAGSADVVISTEMLEHVRDWRIVVANLKGLLRPGGHLLITTRSLGFPYHAWPYDFWRFELDDFSRIFADLEILSLEPDAAAPGVFLFARRPDDYSETTPEVALFSIVTGRRQRGVTDEEIASFMATLPPPSAIPVARRGSTRGPLVAGSRRLGRTVRRRVIRPVWMRLPETMRRRIKWAAGRR